MYKNFTRNSSIADLFSISGKNNERSATMDVTPAPAAEKYPCNQCKITSRKLDLSKFCRSVFGKLKVNWSHRTCQSVDSEQKPIILFCNTHVWSSVFHFLSVTYCYDSHHLAFCGDVGCFQVWLYKTMEI